MSSTTVKPRTILTFAAAFALPLGALGAFSACSVDAVDERKEGITATTANNGFYVGGSLNCPSAWDPVSEQYEWYACWEGTRPIKSWEVMYDMGLAKHIYTYCYKLDDSMITQANARTVYQDDWAGSSHSVWDESSDTFLGCATSGQLVVAAGSTNSYMNKSCYGRKITHKSTGALMEEDGGPFGKKCCDGGYSSLYNCEDFPYSTASQSMYSYKIGTGNCYCYGWAEKFRKAANLKTAGAWTSYGDGNYQYHECDGGGGGGSGSGDGGGGGGHCAGNCGGYSSTGNCYCDAVCVDYGDCCSDACSECGYCDGGGASCTDHCALGDTSCACMVCLEWQWSECCNTGWSGAWC